MSLSDFLGEDVVLNEHEVAWKSKNWDSVKKLADSFKEDPDNEFRDIMNRINSNKTRLNTNVCDSYSSYAINSVLSAHIDCAYHVYNMNLLGDAISDQMHFDYLMHSVRPAKRYGGASAISDGIEAMVQHTFVRCVGLFYCVGKERALEYVSMFTDEQTAYLKKLLMKTATEEVVKEACPYAKKGEIGKVLRVIEDWNK